MDKSSSELLKQTAAKPASPVFQKPALPVKPATTSKLDVPVTPVTASNLAPTPPTSHLSESSTDSSELPEETPSKAAHPVFEKPALPVKSVPASKPDLPTSPPASLTSLSSELPEESPEKTTKPTLKVSTTPSTSDQSECPFDFDLPNYDDDQPQDDGNDNDRMDEDITDKNDKKTAYDKNFFTAPTPATNEEDDEVMYMHTSSDPSAPFADMDILKKIPPRGELKPPQEVDDQFSNRKWLEGPTVRSMICKTLRDQGLHRLNPEAVPTHVFGPLFVHLWLDSSQEKKEQSHRVPGLQDKRRLLFPICTSSSSDLQTILQYFKAGSPCINHWVLLEVDLKDKKGYIYNSMPGYDKAVLILVDAFLSTFSKVYQLGVDNLVPEVRRTGNADGWSCGIDVLADIEEFILKERQPPTNHKIDPYRWIENSVDPLKVWLVREAGFEVTEEENGTGGQVNEKSDKENLGSSSDSDDSDDPDNDSSNSESDPDDKYIIVEAPGTGILIEPVIKASDLKRQLFEVEVSKELYGPAKEGKTKEEYAALPKQPRWRRRQIQTAVRRLLRYTNNIEELFNNVGKNDGNMDDPLNRCFTFIEWEALRDGKVPAKEDVHDHRSGPKCLRAVLLASGMTDKQWELFMLCKFGLLITI